MQPWVTFLVLGQVSVEETAFGPMLYDFLRVDRPEFSEGVGLKLCEN